MTRRPLPDRRPIPLRARAAVLAGRSARVASRLLGRGSGGMIGGTVALTLDPRLLATLSEGVRAVVVSGTNGKSTTTRMVRSALARAGRVASNVNGDNMPEGVVTALMSSPKARLAALEVDEMHVPQVAEAVDPAALVLLNLSRDQLDRVGEIGSVERRLREAVDAHPGAVVVANCDDPLIVSAAWDAPNVVWVAAGQGWGGDSVGFPRGGRVVRSGGDWRVVPVAVMAEDGAPAGPGEDPDEPAVDVTVFRRPEPQWWLEEVDVTGGGARALLCGPDGLRVPLALRLPGRANLGNAAQAVAAAVALGVDVKEAVRAVGRVREVAGRYSTHRIGECEARVMLAKNPAGWQEAMSMVDPQAPDVVIGVNGQVPDGQDLSWLWDVDFGVLAEVPRRRVVACGERGADLAVRLEYAGIHCDRVDTPAEALALCGPGRVEVLLNYTALRDFKRLLDQGAEAVLRAGAGVRRSAAGGAAEPAVPVSEGPRPVSEGEEH